MNKIVLYLLPAKFTYADHLTTSAQRLIIRLAVALLGLMGAGLAVGLLNKGNWADVVAGALFAWTTSFVGWTISSYRKRTEETSRDIRHMAELDLLHGRLNHVAHHNGLPLLEIFSGEIEEVLIAREERIAHLAGLEEYSPSVTEAGASWWDQIALGFPPDTVDRR